MPWCSSGGQLDRGGGFLRGRDSRVQRRLVGISQRSVTTLVEGEFGFDFAGETLEKVIDAELGSALLTRCSQIDDVAIEECRRPFQQEHQLQISRKHCFIVCGPTSQHVAISKFSRKRIKRPFVAFYTNDIHMCHQYDWAR